MCFTGILCNLVTFFKFEITVSPLGLSVLSNAGLLSCCIHLGAGTICLWAHLCQPFATHSRLDSGSVLDSLPP